MTKNSKRCPNYYDKSPQDIAKTKSHEIFGYLIAMMHIIEFKSFKEFNVPFNRNFKYQDV